MASCWRQWDRGFRDFHTENALILLIKITRSCSAKAASSNGQGYGHLKGSFSPCWDHRTKEIG